MELLRASAALLLVMVGVSGPVLSAQDLSPRAYTITPLHANAVTLNDAWNDGELLLEGAAPIADGKGRFNVLAVSCYHSLSFFGRSANVTASLPYGVGTFKGTVLGEAASIYRSGLFSSTFRFSVNLIGGRAMPLSEMKTWRQKNLLGISLRVVAPTGQYDPTKLINLGTNRWAFKPELGYSRRLGHWVFDAYAAVWLYTRNHEFFSRNAYVPGTQAQTQDPVAVLETHVGYDVRPRLWVSLDGNFWQGGRTSLNGVENPATQQRSSRVGMTASFPLSPHQALKVSYADGVYVRYGGNFRIVSAAWQYSWIGKPN